jgi:hypothetical protein
MKNYKPIDGYPDLVRDPITGMIHNINKDKISHVKRIRDQKIAERAEIEQIKTDISDIKQMLLKMLEKTPNA